MDANEKLLTLAPECEIIPGYRLLARIGVGGYGEVWSVVDGNGTKKAVKVFHGQVDDERSARELRGLHRALDLDHPGVLHIDRIEVVCGHVVALMDLAEGTLRDRCDHYRASGLPGIPRDELMRYVREAAEALDYLFENALLAHLDVKPENLLLVDGHVRIGDFGLVKHLEDLNISHVGGMTPRYTAPEVFEGRPTRHSDQYSLAIVYQEMLTGKLPFTGGNMAALAAQHLSSAPQLDALEPLERFAVGKALSKNPQHRFSDCRRFVERLMHRSSATLVTAPADHAVQPQRGEAHDDDASHDGHTIEVALPTVTSLPRMVVPAGTAMQRPSVFIGVGGFGGQVLTKLRQLLTDRVGAAECIPALQLLYVDTDPEAIQGVARAAGDAKLGENEVAFAPLRSSQHYRESILCSLESVSRRWFYNVPRTLRTSGMRALGRLALLDNISEIRAAIRRAICVAVDSPSISQTAEHTKWPMAECDPRVFVVASLSGGTGGGMLVDLGYTVRQILAEVGLADDDVCALLAYGHPRGAANGLSQANAYACLRELQYFGQPGCDYPGELACGMAGFREAGPTFGSTYLFAEGDDIASGGINALADDVAQYLYLSTATASASILDESRRSTRRDERIEGVSLRTAGICALADTSSSDSGPFAEALCRHVVRKWKLGAAAALHDENSVLGELDCDREQSSKLDADVAAAAARESEARGVNVESMLFQIDRALDDVVAADRDAFWATVFDGPGDLTSAGSAKPAGENERALRRLEAFVGTVDGASPRECATGTQQRRLTEILASAARTAGAQLGKDIAQWITTLVDQKNTRVNGALQAAHYFEDRMNAQLHDARERLAAAQAAEEASRKALLASSSSGWLRRGAAKSSHASLVAHAECLCQVARCHALLKGLSAIESQVTFVADSIREHWKSLTQFASRFRALPQRLARGASGKPGNSEDRVAACYEARYSELIDKLDSFCDAHLLSGERSLSKTLATAAAMDELAEGMLTSARRVILATCRDTDHEFLTRVASGDSLQQLGAMVRQSLKGATPPVLRVGGSKRLLLMAPRMSCVEKLRNAIEKVSGDEATLCTEGNETVIVCYEGEDVSWEGIESLLLRQRHDCADMAERLHTRVNIDWNASHSIGARASSPARGALLAVK